MSKRNLALLDTDMFTPIGRLLQQGMAHGITNDMIYGGLEVGQTALQGLYTVQAAQNCIAGTRRVTWDGRVFRYSYSGAACYTHLGNIFYNDVQADGIDYSAVAATSIVGATSVTMTNQGVRAVVANDMVGGQIVLKETDTSDDTAVEIRQIIGNTADDSVGHDGTVIISFAEPLTVALTINVGYAYAMPSPYSNIRYNDNVGVAAHCSHVGVAAAYCSAAALWHWEQVWGKCQLSPHGDCGKTAHEREVVWRYQGSVEVRGETDILGLRQQHAGFIMDNNTRQDGSTMICLQGDK